MPIKTRRSPHAWENMNPGAKFAYTFTAPGTYTYTCVTHSWMRGTAIMVAS